MKFHNCHDALSIILTADNDYYLERIILPL